MLIKVTNRCGAGCSHCFEDSTPSGSHMTAETFGRALDMTRRVEALAWKIGCPPSILLSGGECTEHPDIVKMIETVVAQRLLPVLLTNGMWLADKVMRDALLRPEWPHLFVQVTHDPRFYPSEPPPRIDDRRVHYVESLSVLMPLGRAARKKGGLLDLGVPSRKAPSSFNLRSMTRSLGGIEQAIAMMRSRVALGLSMAGHCTPTVSDTGDVMAGETRLCFKIGTVDSTNEELTRGLVEMRCNRCGLVDNLDLEHKRAIGESTLFAARE